MADIISRLKLESGEFDSKIKRAAQGINQMVAEARKMNSTLISAAGNTEEEVKANMKYIQSLGRMETVSQTARGKLAELTAGFTDLRHAYNQLSPRWAYVWRRCSATARPVLWLTGGSAGPSRWPLKPCTVLSEI